jgi:uncharacterized protein YfcZ (UPF0381/DUF406 family)
MKKKYVIARIEYREFEKYIPIDYRMVLDEVDDNSRFDTLLEAENEIKNKLDKYKTKGWEFTIIILYSS